MTLVGGKSEMLKSAMNPLLDDILAAILSGVYISLMAPEMRSRLPRMLAIHLLTFGST